MRHGAKYRNPKQHACQRGCGAIKTGKIARSCRHERCLCAVRAAQTEVNQLLAGRCEHATGSLGGDQSLVMQQIHQTTFNQLCFAQWRRNAYQRFIGEDQTTFGNSIEVTTKMQSAQ